MAVAHTLSSILPCCLVNKLLILFCAVHIFLHVSSNVIARQSPLHTPTHPSAHMAVVRRYGVFYGAETFVGSTGDKNILAISTASDFNWILCKPCNLCYKTDGIFEPVNSKSYDKRSCIGDRYCSLLPEKRCTGEGKCHYTFKYPLSSSTHNGAYVRGTLSEDILRFHGGENAVHKFTFGCAHETNLGRFNEEIYGMLGLGRGQLSLLSQIGLEIFSFCFPIRDASDGWLDFNPPANDPGDVTTPLHIDNKNDNSALYRVIINSISIKGERIILMAKPHGVDQGAKQGSVFVIATDTPLSYLEDFWMQSLLAEVDMHTPKVNCRCRVSTFKTTCTSLRKFFYAADLELLKRINVYQFLDIPATVLDLNVISRLLGCWSIEEQAFEISGRLLKFTPDEVALLIGMPNSGEEVQILSPLSKYSVIEYKNHAIWYKRSAGEEDKEDNPTHIFVKYLLTNLLFPLNNYNVSQSLISYSDDLENFSSYNWPQAVWRLLHSQFDALSLKYKSKSPLGYINGFGTLLHFWFLEHTNLVQPNLTYVSPRFMKWEIHKTMTYTEFSKVFSRLLIEQVHIDFVDITVDEKKLIGAASPVHPPSSPFQPPSSPRQSPSSPRQPLLVTWYPFKESSHSPSQSYQSISTPPPVDQATSTPPQAKQLPSTPSLPPPSYIAYFEKLLSEAVTKMETFVNNKHNALQSSIDKLEK